MVKSVKYNEQVGTLDVEYHNGSINRYYLVTKTAPPEAPSFSCGEEGGAYFLSF